MAFGTCQGKLNVIFLTFQRSTFSEALDSLKPLCTVGFKKILLTNSLPANLIEKKIAPVQVLGGRKSVKKILKISSGSLHVPIMLLGTCFENRIPNKLDHCPTVQPRPSKGGVQPNQSLNPEVRDPGGGIS